MKKIKRIFRTTEENEVPWDTPIDVVVYPAPVMLPPYPSSNTYATYILN
jgi:hypothetical protein